MIKKIKKNKEYYYLFIICTYFLFFFITASMKPFSIFQQVRFSVTNEQTVIKDYYDGILNYLETNKEGLPITIQSTEWSPYIAYRLNSPVLMSFGCNKTYLQSGKSLYFSSQEICSQAIIPSECKFIENYDNELINISIYKCSSKDNKIYQTYAP